MAKDVRVILKGDARDANAAIKSMQSTGSQAASILEREFSQLGMKSAQIFENQRLAADKAYERIKSSGLATASELERAQKAHAAAMARIDEEEHGKRISLLEKFKTNWLAVTASIAAAWATASKAITLAQDGAKFEQQGTSFANLAAAHGASADKMIADLRRVSGETVSVQQLVEKAGTAMLLGVETQAIPKLMEIAKASSRITGQSVTEAFGDLSLAVARQSKMILDNLGIMIDIEKANKDYAASLGKTSEQLSDAERKQAFLNATMTEGQGIIDKLGKQTESNADKMAKFAASIDNMKISLGTFLAEPMSQISEEVAWALEMLKGNINPVEWFMTNHGDIAKKMEGMSKTALDATMTPEGVALARRKAEEMAKAEAEAAAKAKAEADKKAIEEAKKKRDKELEEIRKHNDRILDIEKKRLSQSLELEKGHLQKLTDDYTAAVSRLDATLDAQAAARKARASRQSVTPAPFGEDEFGAAIRAWDDLGRAAEEAQKIWSPIERAAAQEEIIKRAQDLATKQVELDGAVLLSREESGARAKAIIETQEALIKRSLDAEVVAQTAAAESTAEAMIKKQLEVDAYIDKLTSLEAALDRLNNREINVIFKATGAEQLLAATGADSSEADPASSRFVGPSRLGGLPTSDITTPFGATFHTGTSYVPRDGLYKLSRGESVVNRTETDRASTPAAPVTIAPVFQINGISASGAEKTARELAREIEPELRKLAGRSR